MKKYVMLALVAIFTMSFVANAQDQRPARGEGGRGEGQRVQITAKERAAHLGKQLELTDAQKAKVEALYEKQDKKREEMRAENQKLKEKKDQVAADRKAKFEAQRKADDAELEAIIGKEKMEKLLKIRAERQAKMQERRDNRPGGQGQRPE